MKLTMLAGAPLAALFLLSATAPSGEEILLLGQSRAARLQEVVVSNAGPEGEWDRGTMGMAGTNLVVITPNDEVTSPARTREILSLAKLIFEDTVMVSTGQIGAWYGNGMLAGVELDYFGSADPTSRPQPGEYLGTVGRLQCLDEIGDPIDLGWVYCYDAAQLAAREAALDAGGGLDKLVFHGPVLQSSGTGTQSMFLLTSNTSVQGEVQTNGAFKLIGSDVVAPERIRSMGGSTVRGSGHSLGELVVETQAFTLPAPSGSAGHYQGLATANGTFFNQDVVIRQGAHGPETDQGILLSGVVYSTGDIVVESGALSASLTLISEGNVELGGSKNSLGAAVDGLLAWAIDDGDPETENNVVITGTANTLVGRMFAPGGRFALLGDDAVITGNVIADTILVTGDGHSIGDGTDR